MDKRLFQNVYDVIETSEGWLPLRFTDKQFTHYKSKDISFENRARATAGVSMEFYTDKETVDFNYTNGYFSRRYVGFDYYEDDIFKKHIEEALDTTKGHIQFIKTKKGRSKVTIYIPNLSQVKIKDVDFGDYEPVTEKHKEKILFLGDSITQGMVAYNPSLTFCTQVARALDASSLNRGVGGAKHEVNSLDEDDRYEPTKIFIAYGINDIALLTDISQVTDALRETEKYYIRLKEIYKKAAIYVMTPIWCLRTEEDNWFKDVFDLYRKEQASIACSCGMKVLDGLDLVPHDTRYFQDQSVHPNDAGFLCYCDNILKRI